MVQQRGKRWQANVRLADGSRKRPYFDTKNEAAAWEATARLAIERGELFPAGRAKRKAEPSQVEGTGRRNLTSLGGIFEHVKRSEWAAMKSADTLIRNGKQVCDYFGKGKPVAEITAADVADMKLWFASVGMAPATVNRRIAALSKLLRAAREVGTISVQPVIKWNREQQTRFRYLDRSEEARVLDFWLQRQDEDLHDLTMLLVDTGARCWSEMCAVRWDAFGPELATVTFWTTKTGRPRTVPITGRSRQVLEIRKSRRGGTTGPFTDLNRWTVTDRWKIMRKSLNLPDVTPHTLRHTCCTRLVLGGVDVKRVMQWMGHSAIVTTMRYMQIKPTALEDVLHVLEESS